jgi:ABC-type branched-subunit amino acid transport system permease subunit
MSSALIVGLLGLASLGYALFCYGIGAYIGSQWHLVDRDKWPFRFWTNIVPSGFCSPPTAPTALSTY